jgi:signal transduction histidine kinase
MMRAVRAHLDALVLGEQVEMLYARASIAQATVVVNACLVAWVFWGFVPAGRSIAWVASLCALSALRLALVRAYRRQASVASDARVWAHRFTAGAALTGACWGAAAFVFHAPSSPIRQVFLAFVLGGMTAGAASSNASYTPAFVAFAAPALLPMVVRLAAEREPVHAAMAFMLTLFGVAVAGISRSGSRTIEEALRLRFRNEALVEDLSAAHHSLESLNAELEQRIRGRTDELERILALRTTSEERLAATLEALRESDRKKSEFIAVMSHELRNPLAPIRSSLYVIERAPHDSDEFARAREILRRQTAHLVRLVDDLLDVTRISQGKIELRRARIDARDVVRHACEAFRPEFRERNVELRVETSDPVWIDADETRIAQAVGNLLHNAAKFSGEGGTVVASVRAAGDQAKIRVRDDGVGISAEVLPLVFEPFVQGHGGLARTKGGLGLGLALVKGLVELHGGAVFAHSEGPGRGAELVLTLPLTPAPDRAVTAPASACLPAVAPRREALDVLIIEDNADAARSIADVLRMEGHHVRIAADGRAGLAEARERTPEVVLCDIGLPDLDGYDVARALRTDAALRSTRLIALSGYAQPEDLQRAAEAGFDRHISKPASVDTVLAAIVAVRG